jgi:glyoxylase-like metal-dependent hydrolase (beta-lactamase superfamily II)
MRIGTTRIDGITDGEISGPQDFLYPEQSFRDPGPICSYDHRTGDMVVTTGGFLVRTGDRLYLIDVGNGPYPKTPEFKGGAFRSALLSKGVRPPDITDVVFTHLHFDHIGWASIDGEPFFPNATYRCDRRDWDYFMSPDYDNSWETRTSYPERDTPRVKLEPVRDRMAFWEGDDEVFPGLTTIDAPGHTPGSTALVIESHGERGVVLGDIVHTIPELLEGKAFRMHTTTDQAVHSVLKMRDFVADNGLPCTFSHMPGLCWGRVERAGAAFVWHELPAD